MYQLLWDRKEHDSNYPCPIITVTFAYELHILNVTYGTE